MPMLKINIDLENKRRLKEIAKRVYDDDSDFSISILLNRYLQGIN